MAAPVRVPVEERLFSLVLALLATENGLTKSEILSTVQGYRQRYKTSGDNANLERQFERDKDDIRELGVPLETIQPPGEAVNNQSLRYRIPRGEYELPRDITFSAEETALLGLAAMVWREGTMSTESRRALIKLRALGIDADEPVLAYAPRLRVRDASFEPLNNALERNQIVRFSYLKPGQSEASVREVAPVALFQYQGRWHCSAIEPDTGARKSFLLRRIVSDIAPTGATFPPRDADEGEIALREIEEIWNANTARIRVEPHSDAAMRLRKRRGTREGDNGELLLQFADANLLAEELASYGPEVLVLEPEQLRQAHRSRLAAVLAAHTETEAADG